MKPLVILLLCLCAFAAQAQQSAAFAEYKKVNDLYRSTNAYAMEVNCLIYASYTTDKQESSARSLYIKQGQTVLNKSEQSVILQNEQYLMVVAMSEKKIYLANPVKDLIKTTSLADIEKVLSKGSELTMQDEGSQRLFTVRFKSTGSEYERMHVWVDKKTLFITKMVFYLREEIKARASDPSCKADKPRIEVIIKPLKVSKEEMARELEESSYFLKKKDGYQPSAGYKEFKVVNNIIKR